MVKKARNEKLSSYTYDRFRRTGRNSRRLRHIPTPLGCNDCFYTETGPLRTAPAHLHSFRHTSYTYMSTTALTIHNLIISIYPCYSLVSSQTMLSNYRLSIWFYAPRVTVEKHHRSNTYILQFGQWSYSLYVYSVIWNHILTGVSGHRHRSSRKKKYRVTCYNGKKTGRMHTSNIILIDPVNCFFYFMRRD